MENICKNCGAIVKQGTYCLYCGFGVDGMLNFPQKREVSARLSFQLEECNFDEEMIKRMIFNQLFSHVLTKTDFKEINCSIKPEQNECRLELTMEYAVY